MKTNIRIKWGENLNIYAKIIEEIRFLFPFPGFVIILHPMKIKINALPQH